MWLLVLVFLLLTLLIAWTLFGYLIYIWAMGLFQRKSIPEWPSDWPMLSVIVPCYNESAQILEKLQDIRQQAYPVEKLEVFFVDGGSADDTVAKLTAAIKPDEPYRVIGCPVKGKINQLNHVLAMAKGQVVVNTDVDARLAPDALKWLVAEFTQDPNVWAAGAYCRPEDTLEAERYYWDTQNKLRLIESDARTTSIVIAPCYAFRRELMQDFPCDVVADDIYVAFLSNSLGHRTVYSRNSTAIEVRGPKTYSEFIPHKFRKSNAFLRETLRFLYRLPEMSPFCKIMLLTRIMQQLLLPVAAMFWVLIAGVLMTLFRFDIVIYATILFLLCLMLTSRVFAAIPMPHSRQRFSAKAMIKGYIVTVIIMLATGVTYPFFNQGCSYARLAEPCKKGDV